jgi:hypothetical protein
MNTHADDHAQKVHALLRKEKGPFQRIEGFDHRVRNGVSLYSVKIIGTICSSKFI